VDLSSLKILPIDGFHWKLRQIQTFGPDKEELLCTEIEATVRSMKQTRNNKKNKNNN
jgi:hypothetical protein